MNIIQSRLITCCYIFNHKMITFSIKNLQYFPIKNLLRNIFRYFWYSLFFSLKISRKPCVLNIVSIIRPFRMIAFLNYKIVQYSFAYIIKNNTVFFSFKSSRNKTRWTKINCFLKSYSTLITILVVNFVQYLLKIGCLI